MAAVTAGPVRGRGSLRSGHVVLVPLAELRLLEQKGYKVRSIDDSSARLPEPKQRIALPGDRIVIEFVGPYPRGVVRVEPNEIKPVRLIERVDKDWETELYLHLARGLSIRKFPSPYSWRLTKTGARYFMQAPDDLRPLSAFRWAQIRSLGGDKRLARCLLQSVLVAPTPDEGFWAAVIRFLIENGPLATDEVESIVNFIHRQRFVAAEVTWGRGAGSDPLHSDLSLAGWSLSALRRHMANWRAELASQMPARFCVEQRPGWQPTTIQPLEESDGLETWSIRELLTASELRVEGGIMRHCVGSYVSACRSRRTSIWSMRVDRGQAQRRELTIEVLPETKAARRRVSSTLLRRRR